MSLPVLSFAANFVISISSFNSDAIASKESSETAYIDALIKADFLPTFGLNGSALALPKSVLPGLFTGLLPLVLLAGLE